MNTLKSMFAMFVATLVLTLTPQVSRAQEEVPVAPAVTVEAPAPAEAPAVEEKADPVWFGDVQLWEVVAAIVALIWGVVKARMKISQDWERKLLSFVEAGVQLTYDEFVKDAKKQAPEGKLTKEQISAARQRAWEAAKTYASEQGVDLVKQVAAEQIPVLISKVVKGFKTK